MYREGNAHRYRNGWTSASASRGVHSRSRSRALSLKLKRLDRRPRYRRRGHRSCCRRQRRRGVGRRGMRWERGKRRAIQEMQRDLTHTSMPASLPQTRVPTMGLVLVLVLSLVRMERVRVRKVRRRPRPSARPQRLPTITHIQRPLASSPDAPRPISTIRTAPSSLGRTCCTHRHRTTSSCTHHHRGSTTTTTRPSIRQRSRTRRNTRQERLLLLPLPLPSLRLLCLAVLHGLPGGRARGREWGDYAFDAAGFVCSYSSYSSYSSWRWVSFESRIS